MSGVVFSDEHGTILASASGDGVPRVGERVEIMEQGAPGGAFYVVTDVSWQVTGTRIRGLVAFITVKEAACG